MRSTFRSKSSRGAFRSHVATFSSLLAVAGSLSGASAADSNATCRCHAGSLAADHSFQARYSLQPGIRLSQALYDGYAGHAVSIAMWKARSPKTAARTEEISSRAVREIVTFLRNSQVFQEILEKLETDRTERFTRTRKRCFERDPRGAFVRETAVVMWIPKGDGEMGVYSQRSGGTFVHSQFSDDPAGDTLKTPCDVILNPAAKYQVRIHTHPWGTVPSAGDLKNTAAGVADLVLSQKNGIPTTYVYSAWGTVWEMPTALFLNPQQTPREPEQLVAQR